MVPSPEDFVCTKVKRVLTGTHLEDTSWGVSCSFVKKTCCNCKGTKAPMECIAFCYSTCYINYRHIYILTFLALGAHHISGIACIVVGGTKLMHIHICIHTKYVISLYALEGSSVI